MTTPKQEPETTAKSKMLIGVVAVAASMVLAWLNLDQGFIAHDEGQLGQAAERVLAGELPHRDFDDMYTGGLSYLNAVGFHCWGVHSHSLRLMLFVWLVPFLAAIYWLLSQFALPLVAGLLTFLAAAWSIPMYSVPMPSWYNLFFATWALVAVVHFLRSNHRAYLLLAGLMIGLSIVMKVSGVYVLAAVLLSLLHRNQETFRGQSLTNRRLSGIVTAALVLASLISLAFLNRNDMLAHTFHLVLPFVALTGFVIYNEWSVAGAEFAQRSRPITIDVAVLFVGVAIPVGLFVGHYYRQDAISALIHGTMVMPKARFEFAAAPFPHLGNVLYAIPLAMLLFPKLAGSFFRREQESRIAVAAAVFAWVVFIFRNTPGGFSIGFQSVRNMTPLLVFGNLWLLVRLRDRLASVQAQTVYAVTATAFFCSLIQFPSPAPIYFFYSAPLLLVGALAATSMHEWVPKTTLAVVTVFLIVFSCVRFHSHNSVICLRPSFQESQPLELVSSRVHLTVDHNLANIFNRLHEVIEANSFAGDTILSTPDAPSPPFFTGRRALNGVMYEFFREGIYDDVEAVKEELLAAGVNLVVINEMPAFSRKVTDEFRTVALADFQVLERVGVNKVTVFTVYKRRPSGSSGETENSEQGLTAAE